MRRIIRLTESDIRRMVYEAIGEAKKSKRIDNFTTNASDSKYTGTLAKWIQACQNFGVDSSRAKNIFGQFVVDFDSVGCRLAGAGLSMWNSEGTFGKALSAAKRKFFQVTGPDGEVQYFNMDKVMKDDEGKPKINPMTGEYIPSDDATPVKNLPSTAFGDVDAKDYVAADGDTPDVIKRKEAEAQEIMNNPNIARYNRDGGKTTHQAPKHLNAYDEETQHRVYMDWYMGNEELGGEALESSFPAMADEFFKKGLMNGPAATLNAIKASITIFAKSFATANSNELATNNNSPTSYETLINDPTDEWGNSIKDNNDPADSDTIGANPQSDEEDEIDPSEVEEFGGARGGRATVGTDIEPDDSDPNGKVIDVDNSENHSVTQMLSTIDSLMANWKETGLPDNDKETMQCISDAFNMLKSSNPEDQAKAAEMVEVSSPRFCKYAFANLYKGSLGWEWFRHSWARCIRLAANSAGERNVRECRLFCKRILAEYRLRKAVNESINRMLKNILY